MSRNKLGINTIFGLSYFFISFFGSLIPDPPKNQGQLLNTSSAKHIEVSLGAMPIGQGNPKADNLAFAESPETGPRNSSFISTKPTKLPIQGSVTENPNYSKSGLEDVGPMESFTNNAFCPTPVIQAHTIYVCSGVPFQYKVPAGGVNNDSSHPLLNTFGALSPLMDSMIM